MRSIERGNPHYLSASSDCRSSCLVKTMSRKLARHRRSFGLAPTQFSFHVRSSHVLTRAAPRGSNHMWSEAVLLLGSSAARAARTGPALSRLAGPDLASATHQKIIRKSHFQMFFRGIFEMHMFSVNSSMSGSTHKSQGRPGPPKSQSCRSAPPTRQPSAPSSIFTLDAPIANSIDGRFASYRSYCRCRKFH